MSWQNKEWEEANEVLLGDIDDILRLCTVVYNLVPRVTSHRARFQEVREHVRVLEEMALSVKRRPESASPDARMALVDVARCLSNTADFLGKVSRANAMVSFLKSGSTESKIQEVIWKLGENVRQLSEALPGSHGGTQKAGGADTGGHHAWKLADEGAGWAGSPLPAPPLAMPSPGPVFYSAMPSYTPVMVPRVLYHPPANIVTSTVVSCNRTPAHSALNLAQQYACVPTPVLAQSCVMSGSLPPLACISFGPHLL